MNHDVVFRACCAAHEETTKSVHADHFPQRAPALKHKVITFFAKHIASHRQANKRRQAKCLKCLSVDVERLP